MVKWCLADVGLSTAPLAAPLHLSGTTHVTDQSWLAELAFEGVFANFDSTFDEVGDGHARTSWTIAGTRAGGKAFTVTRSNRWASFDDIAGDPASDVAIAVDQIVNNEFEKVKVNRVAFSSVVSTKFSQVSITSVEVSVNGKKYTKPATLKVKAGDSLKVRVTLRPYQSSATSKVTLAVKVPKKAAGTVGSLDVTGGFGGSDSADDEGGGEGCLLTAKGCDTESGPQSLNGVIRSITSAPHNNDLSAGLVLESEKSGKTQTASTTKRQTSVVTGQRSIQVQVK